MTQTTHDHTELDALIEQSRKAVEAMTPEQRAEMWRAQRRSFIRADAGFGSDADEAAYRGALEAGDAEAIKRLDKESRARVAQVEALMDERGI